MKTTFVVAALATTLFAVPAFADCAGDLTKIDAAMKTAMLDETSATKAKELMEKALTARTANDEVSCMAATKDLMSLVGLHPAQ